MKTKNRTDNFFYLQPDFIVVLCMILAFIPIILYFQVRFMTSTILFFVVPSIYLFIRKSKNPKRIFSTVLIGTIASFILDFLAEFNGAWAWAPYGQLIFKNKILGYVTPDVMIWFIFWIFLTVVFYEHFFEHEKSDKISYRFKYSVASIIGILALLIFLYLYYPSFLYFRYAYLLIGIFFGAAPLISVLWRNPKLIIKFMKASVFLVFLFLSFEITALKLNQWRFPGEYIGQISLLGVSFPFEEFFFWILMSTAISLSYYELFVDDER